jgi:hypothetical protein
MTRGSVAASAEGQTPTLHNQPPAAILHNGPRLPNATPSEFSGPPRYHRARRIIADFLPQFRKSIAPLGLSIYYADACQWSPRTLAKINRSRP